MSDALSLSTSSSGGSRQWLACAVLLAASTHAGLAQAADRPATFPVSAPQMQALGIQLQRLGAQADVAGLSYPSRVVLPPQRQQVVAAPVAGVVDRLLVADNDVVKPGQPLLRLLSPELGELQLKLMEAVSRERLAAQALARERQLLADGIIPARRVQEAEAGALEARARRQQAEAALRLTGLDDGAIRRVATGGATADTAVTLRARTGGVVTTLTVRPGQRVQQADALMEIADTRELWLEVQVPIARRAEVSTARGAAVTVTGRESIQASVVSTGAAVGDGQTFLLRASVRQGSQALRPGEFVQVHLPLAATDGWAVPLAAVAREERQAYVFVRTAEGFTAKPVEIVATGESSLRVKGALQAGQQIAVTSVIALKAAWQGKGGGE